MRRKSVQAFRGLMLVVLVFAFSIERSAAQPQPQTTFERLASWISGSFSSAEQASRDTSFSDNVLVMVPIWKARGDGYWFYVEQAASASLDKPYRQRVYHLVQRSDTLFENLIFLLPSPLRFAGEWTTPNPLVTLHPDSLVLRNGCSMLFRPLGDSAFGGATYGRGCPSEFRGAAYTTSQVLLKASGMLTWDRGFTQSGTQVWGHRKGGFMFNKTRSFPVR